MELCSALGLSTNLSSAPPSTANVSGDCKPGYGTPRAFRRANMHDWPSASFSSAHLVMQHQVLEATIHEREICEEGYASTHEDRLTTTDIPRMGDW
jgi:hypothetical protein